MPDQLSDVLDRLHTAVGDVVHVLALDTVDRVVLADGSASDAHVSAARAVAATLAFLDTTGESVVRSVVETAEATLYAVHHPTGFVVVLVGPAAWNVALARRSADAVLRDVDAAAVVDPLREQRRAQTTAGSDTRTPARGTFAETRRAAIRTTGTGT
jgi:hypothetical protein